MLTASIDGRQVIATEVTRGQGQFACPACGDEVILRKGRRRIHHFAHRPAATCAWGVGETEEHRRVKLSVYRALLDVAHVEDVSLERGFGRCRPDVYALIRGEGVAIEIQRSAISDDEMRRRTKLLWREGIATLWVVPRLRVDQVPVALGRPDLGVRERMSPRTYERWLHALYFGRVYYWVGGLDLQPVHFAKYELFREDGYDADGNEYAGGSYRSRRWVKPELGTVCNIARDFSARARDRWSGGRLADVPACGIYVDRQQRWW